MTSITTHLPAVAQGLYSGLFRSNYFYSFFVTPPNYLCSKSSGTQAFKYLEHVVQTFAIQKGYLELTFTPNQNLQKWGGRILLVTGLLIAASKSIEYWATKGNSQNERKFSLINRVISYLNTGMACVYYVNTVFLIYSAIKTRQTPEIAAAVIGSFNLISNIKNSNDKPQFPAANRVMGVVRDLAIISRIYYTTKQQEKLFLGALFLFDVYKSYRIIQKQLPRKLI